MNVAVSQAEFGLCNVVFGQALIPEQEISPNAHKADDPPVLYLLNNLSSALLFCHPDSYIYLSCAPYLTSSPVLYSLSHFELLSLSSCHRGKQNTVAMETAHREERVSLWDFQCGDRSLYMAISCRRAGRWVQPSMNIVSLFLCEKLPDRWSDRQSEKDTWKKRGRDGERKGNEETGRKMYGVCWSSWYWSLDLAGTALLLLDHPAFSLLHNTTYTIPSSTSLDFCSGYDSPH